MLLDDIRTICVCGAGTMGSGIAQVCARAGYEVILYDVQAASLQSAARQTEQHLQRLTDQGRITATEKECITGRILLTTDIGRCKAELVIEAVAEQPDVKHTLFHQLSRINDAATLFASNTSSLSITALQQQVPHPQRVAGLHFFNPAAIMKLVEVVKGDQTADATIDTLLALAGRLGKTPVVCKDVPGFIVNRVARPYYLEALRIVEEGIATMEEVDVIMEASGFRLGPFKLMDLIGLDINYAASKMVYEALGQPERLRPSALQQEKIAAGQLGRKAGRGFYDYT